MLEASICHRHLCLNRLISGAITSMSYRNSDCNWEGRMQIPMTCKKDIRWQLDLYMRLLRMVRNRSSRRETAAPARPRATPEFQRDGYT